MLFRNRFCGASFLVGQGRGWSTILPGLDVNPGTVYLDAAPPPLPPTGAEWRTGGVLARNMMPGGHQEQRPVPLELRARDISRIRGQRTPNGSSQGQIE